jgi:hypothetical protein
MVIMDIVSSFLKMATCNFNPGFPSRSLNPGDITRTIFILTLMLVPGIIKAGPRIESLQGFRLPPTNALPPGLELLF